MKLPVAFQTALDRSEKQFQDVLERLGLTREGLTRAASRIKEKTKQVRANPDENTGRRTYHV